MKKKILSLFFAICLIIPCALFIGCTKDNDSTKSNQPEPTPPNEVNVLLSNDGKTLYRFSPDNDETVYSVPDGVVKIASSAFKNCENLTKVIFPDTLESIEELAFYQCINLTTVEINSDISVGNKSFSSCYKLSDIDTSKIISYGEESFFECGSLTSITIAKEVKLLPYKVFGYWILSNTNLSSVTFEENSTLETIYSEAFIGNNNLTTINIPNTCTFIGKEAFAFTGLTNITIGKNVERLDSKAFYYCENLTTIEFETGRLNTLNSLYDVENIFAFCSNLTTVTNYPITSIDNGCFKNCYNLKTITFENGSGYASINKEAFYGCYSLTEFTIPSHMDAVNNDAFDSCYNLTKLTILGNTFIDSSAFNDCISLFEIYNISNSQLTKGQGVATYAKDIYTSLSATSKIRTINNVIYYNNGTDFIALAPVNINVTSIDFYAETTEINKQAFYSCENLKSVSIPENISTIGLSAFNYCNLESVVINSEEISNTCINYNSNGHLLWKTDTIYIKKGLLTTHSTYLLNNFEKQSVSDKSGYDMYCRK